MGGPSPEPATDDRREARRRLTEALATVDPIGTDLGWDARLDEYRAPADSIARRIEAGEPLREAVVAVFEHECGFEPGRDDLARICSQCGGPDEADCRQRRRRHSLVRKVAYVVGIAVGAIPVFVVSSGLEPGSSWYQACLSLMTVGYGYFIFEFVGKAVERIGPGRPSKLNRGLDS